METEWFFPASQILRRVGNGELVVMSGEHQFITKYLTTQDLHSLSQVRPPNVEKSGPLNGATIPLGSPVFDTVVQREGGSWLQISARCLVGGG